MNSLGGTETYSQGVFETILHELDIIAFVIEMGFALNQAFQLFRPVCPVCIVSLIASSVQNGFAKQEF